MKKIIYAAMLLLGLSMMASSCGNSSKNNLEGYEWLEGKWKGTDVQQIFVNITPQYIQTVGEFWDEDMDVENAEKCNYSIQIINNSFLGDIKGICTGPEYATIFIDDAKQAIYWIYDFDSKIYLTKE